MTVLATVRRRRPEAWVIATMGALLVSMTAHAAIRPMVSYRALELGASPATVGLIAGGYATAALLMAIPLGRAGDRFGALPLTIAGTIGTAASIGSLLWISSLPMLAISQVALGTTHLTTQIGLQTMMAKSSPARDRDTLFGAMAAIASLAQMIGPIAAGGLADDGRTSAAMFLAGAGMAAAATVISFALLPYPSARGSGRNSAQHPNQPDKTQPDKTQPDKTQPDKTQPDKTRRADSTGARVRRRRSAHARPGTWQILRIKGVSRALTINFTIIASVDLIAVYLPVFGEARGLPVTVVTTLLAIRAGTSMLSRAAMSPLIRMVGRKRLLIAGSLLPGLALFALPLTTHTVALYTLMALAGFFLGLGQPLTLVWVINQVPPEIQGAVLGLRLSGNKAVQLVMPVAAGAIAGSLGVAAAFWLIAGMLTAGVATLRGVEFDRAPGTEASS